MKEFVAAHMGVILWVTGGVVVVIWTFLLVLGTTSRAGDDDE